jgi:hypothetical protein
VTEPFLLGLDQIQPSQLFINRAKLARVQAGFHPEQPVVMEPLPVRRFGTRLVFTDGHTRALAAYLAGLRSVSVVWDEDDLDWEAYQICVDWCLEAGIRTIADLADRIVPAREYEVVWLQRCARMQRALAESRGSS